MKTIVVVPCYNESKRLRQDDFLHYVEQNDDVAFLFANDGSRDNTLEVLQELTAKHERLLMLDIQPNGGKAEAVRKGMLYAAEQYKPDYIAFWDADLATPLEEIEPMVKWADKGYDAVMGLRLMRLGAKVKRKTMRHYLGRCFATVASMMLKLPVYDTQCGSKLFRREVVEAIFQEQFITRWLFDVELLARYKQRYGVEQAIQKIYEYPLFQWEDVDGSQLKSRDFFKAPLELMKIRKRYKNKN
ncbi:MAG: glycosyltransferase [Bacteroidales bacterium]|jgi:glycosyltransferase involved in cell wall biosynthesis|nr:glycosyltransferase [Bacteroidales bacterium]MCR4931934.1 glycosyltransferase [Bacteroidales bacterium]